MMRADNGGNPKSKIFSRVPFLLPAGVGKHDPSPGNAIWRLQGLLLPFMTQAISHAGKSLSLEVCAKHALYYAYDNGVLALCFRHP